MVFDRESSLCLLQLTLHLMGLISRMLIWLFTELSDDPGTFVHRCGRTDYAGKEGNVILMFTSNQRRAIRSLERVAGCKFEFVNPPAIEEVLESSAEQMVATLDGVQTESSQFFAPSAQKLIEEQRRSALPTRLGHSSKKEPHAELSTLGRHLSMSAQEARTVIDQIRGRSYEETLMILELIRCRACYPVLELVYSAAAKPILVIRKDGE